MDEEIKEPSPEEIPAGEPEPEPEPAPPWAAQLQQTIAGLSEVLGKLSAPRPAPAPAPVAKPTEVPAEFREFETAWGEYMNWKLNQRITPLEREAIVTRAIIADDQDQRTFYGDRPQAKERKAEIEAKVVEGYRTGGVVRREDVWRLLHDPDAIKAEGKAEGHQEGKETATLRAAERRAAAGETTTVVPMRARSAGGKVPITRETVADGTAAAALGDTPI